jgi:uncharacterized protein
MKTIDVLVARVYVMESSHLLKEIINYLNDELHIRGVSVFRAIQGIGDSGKHAMNVLDLALDLPLTIEFFDDEVKVKQGIDYLNQFIKPEHILFWKAKTNA